MCTGIMLGRKSFAQAEANERCDLTEKDLLNISLILLLTARSYLINTLKALND